MILIREKKITVRRRMITANDNMIMSNFFLFEVIRKEFISLKIVNYPIKMKG